MRIVWGETVKHWPIVKVDGQAIRNAIIADDVEGVVEFVKHNKIRTIRGNVEIISG
jgi:hypothetical protein